MGKKYTKSDLLDSIQTVSTIICTVCEGEDEIMDDTYESVEYFFKEGWRATTKKTYCPKCAKKYLKQ